MSTDSINNDSSVANTNLNTILQQRNIIFDNKQLLQQLTNAIIDYMCSNGITMLHKQYIQQYLYTHAPTTLLPTPIPRTQYTNLTTLSSIWNKLIDNIARHDTFITDSLKTVISTDEFTRNLYNVYLKTKTTSIKQQQYMLGIFRSDYMLHYNNDKQSYEAQQVEINTIAASFGALSCKITNLHSYITQRYFNEYNNWFCPKNDTVHNIANALIQATYTYCKTRDITFNNNQHAILFVTQHNETNVTDQRDIEYNMFQQSNIHCIRATLNDIYKHGQFNTVNNINIFTLYNYEITVVYYRSAYTPRDFSSEQDWQTLLNIELSYSIKCPTTAYHLAGTKKVQQLLTQYDILTTLVNESEARLIQSVQTDMYGFDTALSQDTLNEVKNNINNYVLKPCREGGGNNIWGNDIIHILDNSSDIELQQYILMKRINVQSIHSILIKQGVLTDCQVISELGIYSTYLSNGSNNDIVVDNYAGHLLRTKTADSNEGGVAAGFAVIDSPLLYNDVQQI